MEKTLDLISIGRSSVDLYGQQIGSRLEDIGSFAKSVGGCPANIAIGTARLGLKSALITRVGAEQMGNFIREQLVREGVAVDGVHVDKDRLSALVLLAVQSEGVSPTTFYRADCADMALDESDIDEAFVAQSPRDRRDRNAFLEGSAAAAAQAKAIALARKHGGKVVFDVDYRPNLWGLAGHDAGFERYVKSEAVSARLKTVLPDCDLIVGTEEEIMVAGGADSVLDALKSIRAISGATVVLKRGAHGCIVYDGPIADDLEAGIVGRGFPIEVFNVLGAGDAFMSGFLRGWLKGEDLATSATWANACGAFAVSRLLCSTEYPTWAELKHFLDHGSRERALRKDAALNHIHWATTRRRDYPRLMALAIDHRTQLEDLAADDAAVARIPAFKVLAVRAARRVANGRPGFGMLLDDKYGRDALFAAGAGQDLWVAKPIELPGSRPLQFEFSQDLGSRLSRMAGGPLHQGAVLLPSGRRRGAEARADREARLRLRRRAQGRARDPDRDHRLEVRPACRTTRSRARSPSFMTPASSPTGGSSNRRRPSRPGGRSTTSSPRAIRTAAASCCSASMPLSRR